MKVLFLESSLGRGGAQRQLVTLACGLARRGHHVVVALFYDVGPLVADLRAAGIVIRVLGKQGRWDIAGLLLGLRRAVREEQPDVLCTFLTVPNLASVFCRLLKPRLSLVWGIRASNMDLRRYDWVARLTYGLEPYLARFADRVVANSEQGQAVALAKGFPRDRVIVIRNGIDTQRFRPDPAGRAQVRTEWGLPEKAILVGLIGRLDPMKDHETFLRAAAIVAPRDPDVQFACIGDEGPIRRKDLESRAVSLGLGERVIWSGGRDDMRAVYNACDLVCLTSAFGEGFSNALAEAMACGKVCVATRVGDAEAVLGPVGRTVEPGDAEGLARHLFELCRDIRAGQLHGAASRERMTELFSIETMVTAFEQLFAKSVEQARSSARDPAERT